jgi:hypothetical protein
MHIIGSSELRKMFEAVSCTKPVYTLNVDTLFPNGKGKIFKTSSLQYNFRAISDEAKFQCNMSY